MADIVCLPMDPYAMVTIDRHYSDTKTQAYQGVNYCRLRRRAGDTLPACLAPAGSYSSASSLDNHLQWVKSTTNMSTNAVGYKC